MPRPPTAPSRIVQSSQGQRAQATSRLRTILHDREQKVLSEDGHICAPGDPLDIRDTRSLLGCIRPVYRTGMRTAASMIITSVMQRQHPFCHAFAEYSRNAPYWSAALLWVIGQIRHRRKTKAILHNYLRKSSIGSFSKSASATPSASLSVLNRSSGIKDVPLTLVISKIHSGSSIPR